MTVSLSATTRSVLGKRVKSLRNDGSVPGIIYGHGTQPTPVTVDASALDKAYRQAGESTLVDLAIDGSASTKVIIQEVQHDPLSHVIRHVDFHQVRMDEKLEVDIPLKFVGESPAVKELGGILSKAVGELKVKCLPNDLVHEIEVDISPLKEFEQTIAVRDIMLPSGIEVMSPPMEEVVATVTPPRSEAELAELKAEVKEDVGTVEVAEKGKEEPTEGAAEPAAKEEKKEKK